MKFSGEGVNVVVSFHSLEVQLTVVGNAVLVKVAAVGKHVESGAHVGVVRYARCKFRASPEK
jgi:hypothetical protein